MTEFREAVINLGAVAANVAHLRAVIGTPHFMAVVKANAYGHGAVPVARTALAAGADWLGVADLTEAHALRDAGITAPLLAWLHGPDTDFAPAIAEGIDLGLSSAAQLRAVADAAGRLGRVANVQLKLDTGLSRNGVNGPDWADVFALAAGFERDGLVHVRGIFSHLANASSAADAEAVARFTSGLDLAAAAGLTPGLVHLASTAAALRLPSARFSMVRIGIGLYGLSPFDDATPRELGLVPAMTLRASVAAVRRVPEGAGVSYDYLWHAPEDVNLALVPLGYADGVPRSASGSAEVSINGRRYPIVGRIAMDQFVVNLGQDVVAVGDDVVLFGDPDARESESESERGLVQGLVPEVRPEPVPSATDWADAAGTINYEIVTRIGPRVPRSYRAVLSESEEPVR